MTVMFTSGRRLKGMVICMLYTLQDGARENAHSLLMHTVHRCVHVCACSNVDKCVLAPRPVRLRRLAKNSFLIHSNAATQHPHY